MYLKAALLCAASWPAFADTRVWLIGGGDALENSQGQIEANVRWLEDLMLASGLDVHTYFALGERPGMDVVYRGANESERRAANPWTRVFGDDSGVPLLHKRHDLRALRGSTDEQELSAALSRDFARVAADDEVLIVYNGHGGLDRADTRDNYLKLWGGGRMTVAELETLLDSVPPAATTRFVMTQCYSGAFHALIYDDPRTEQGFRGNRCGFFAESAVRQAEGCELDVHAAEFRDYTTYFFAALNGATRQGEHLPLGTVDRDADGVVSYREAHFHALVAAHSADLSRSTSEQFLENWSPWYVRWDSLAENPASVYSTLAAEVAARYGWSATSPQLHELLRRHSAAQADGERRRAAARRRIEALRAGLRADFATGRSGDGNAYAGAAFGTAEPAAERALVRDPRFIELEREQQALGPLAAEVLEQTRLVTQVEKIYRLRHMARLESALQVYGSRQARQQYRQLLQCESGSLQ